MSVTIRELAKVAGVSITTVSRVLNNNEHAVNLETKQRILSLAEELGYQPNIAARSLRNDRTEMIGVVADSTISPFTPVIIHAIEKYLKQHGYVCIFINTSWNPEKEKKAVRDLLSRSADGIIFVESWHQNTNQDLDLANKPYVFVHRLFNAPNKHSVIPDEIYGAEVATRHLVQLGHKRIGFINGPTNYFATSLRLKGYEQELSKFQIEFDKNLISDGNWGIQSGYDACKQLLLLSHPPSAIFAANDLMALGAIYAAQDSGLRVPEDLAIVGYDDRDIASLVRPAITTVSLPAYEMGETAAKMVLSLIKNHDEYQEEIKLKGQLIIRQSCGDVSGDQFTWPNYAGTRWEGKYQ